MKINKIILRATFISAITSTALFAQTWPEDSELNLVSSPTGSITDAIIQAGINQGDIGVFLDGIISNRIYAGNSTNPNANQNVWLKTKNLTGGTSARIYAGALVTNGNYVSGDINSIIGGYDTELLLQRYYGGNYVEGEGVTSSAKNINVDIYSGLTVQGGSIFAAGQVWSNAKSSVENVTLNLYGGFVDTPLTPTDPVHSVTGGVMGGFHVGGSATYTQTEGVLKSIVINLGDAIYINGNIFAGGEASDYGSIKVTNGITTNIKGANLIISESVYGGARATFGSGVGKANAKVTGTSKVVMSNGTVNQDILAGALASGSSTSTVDASLVEMSNGNVKGNVFGGSMAQQNGRVENGSTTDDVSTVVAKVILTGTASVEGNVYAGSYTENSTSGNPLENGSFIFGSTSVNMAGGSVANVYGGSLTYSNGLNKDAIANISGNTDVYISGGNVAGSVYGGGNVIQFSGTGKLGTSIIEGNTNVTLAQNAVVNGDVFGGGNGERTFVKGNATVTISGNSFVGGSVYAGGANGAVVNGDATVNIINASVKNVADTQSGSIGGSFIVNMDKGSIADSNNPYSMGVTALSTANTILDMKNGSSIAMKSTQAQANVSTAVGVFADNLTASIKDSSINANANASTMVVRAEGIEATNVNVVLDNSKITTSSINSAANSLGESYGVASMESADITMQNNSEINSSVSVDSGEGYASALYSYANINLNINDSKLSATANSSGLQNVSIITQDAGAYTIFAETGSISGTIANSTVSAISDKNQKVALYAGKSGSSINISNSSIKGDVNLNSDATINAIQGSSTINGLVAGVKSFNVSAGADLTLNALDATNLNSFVSTDNSTAISKTGSGTLNVNGSMLNYTGSLNVKEGTLNLSSQLSASVLDVSAGADFNAIISDKNVGSFILNVGQINGLDSLNVGFDIRNSGSGILGKTVDIFNQGSASIAYNVAGQNGLYKVGDMYLSYTNDGNGKINIGNTLTIGSVDDGGTKVVIEKDANSGSVALTTTNNQTEAVVESTKQTVTSIDASQSTLVVGANSEIATSVVTENSTVKVNDDSAKLQITEAIKDSATVQVSAGEVSISGVTTTADADRATTIGGANADVIVDAGKIVVNDSTKSLNLTDTINVATGKQLEIAANLTLSGEKTISSEATGSSIKLQSNVTFEDSSAKLILSGNSSGSASFTGVVDGTSGAKSTLVVKGNLSIGNSPAVVTYTNVTVDMAQALDSSNVLKMEVFGTGTTAGKDFDQVILDNAKIDFGAPNAGKIEISIDSQPETSFSEGTFVFSLFQLTNGSEIIGVENGDVSIVLAQVIKEAWNVVFSATGTTELTDQTALDSLMKDGTVSLTFSKVPEPATLAAIFGALALAFATYRRR